MVRADDTALIDSFEEFYQSYYEDDIEELAEQYSDGQRSLHIDWEDLWQFDSDLADDMLNKPAQVREYAEEALRLYDIPVDVSLGQAHIRVHNLSTTTPISEIDSDDRGALVQFTGSVEKSTEVNPNITTAAFECQRCGTLTRIPQDGDLQKPHECQGCERQGPFRINHDQSEFIDAQRLYIEEFTNGFEDTGPAGIEVEIEDDLTGTVTIGDAVIVTGIVRLKQESNSSRFGFYIGGVSIQESDRIYPDLQITKQEKQEIIELSNKDNLFTQLEESIAPTVYGKEMEKRALLLQLFNGIQKNHADGTQIRGSIHTLFVTDPGTFIERVLGSAAHNSPNAVEISGSETSATGLTTSAVRSNGNRNNGGWEIGAGPLIKADQGHAFINGIGDLGSGAESSLETVMTQQSVNASKATASTSYPARTSILAVGNPAYGRFDEYEPIASQIEISGDLISAFDLVFPLTDQPSPLEDKKSAEHTLQTAKSGEIKTHYEETTTSTYSKEETEEATAEVSPPIEPELFRKYVAFAREHCYPTLSEDARETLQEYYVEVRSRGEQEDAPVPISEQKLETLVRLAEASARMRLSDTVKKEDAERATDLLQYMLEKLGLDPAAGGLDIDPTMTKDRAATVNSETELLTEEMIEQWREYDTATRSDIFKEVVDYYANQNENGALVETIIEFAESVGMDQSTVEHELDKLKQKGEVYEPKADHLRTT